MASERQRHILHEELNQYLTPLSTDELMDYLPPVGWADVATKADLGIIRNEMDALRAELRGDNAELRGEIKALRSEVRGEIGALRSEVRGEIDLLRSEVRGEIDSLRSEIAVVRSDLGGEIRGLRLESEGEFKALRFAMEAQGDRLSRDIARATDQMRVWMIATMLAFIFGMAGLLLGAAQLQS
jgi:hypothetical protein